MTLEIEISFHALLIDADLPNQERDHKTLTFAWHVINTRGANVVDVFQLN